MNTRKIGVRSLMYFMVRRIWIILLTAVLFGAALAGYKYYSDRKASKSAVKDDGTSLSDAERADVENAALQYRNAAEMESYLNSSPLLKLNSKSEEQTIVEYQILLDTGAAEPSTGTVENSYLQLLRAYINDGMYIRDLAEIRADYAEHAFMKELVWCNNSGGGEFTLGVINYSDYPDLPKDVRTVTEAYMDQLMKAESRLRIKAMKEGTVNLYDSTTDSTQKSVYTNMVNYRKAYMNAYTAFSEAQQAYFRKLTGYLKDQASDTRTTKVKISKRLLVAGCLVGLVAGVGICFLLLYISLKNRTQLDYSDNLGLRDLGLVTTAGKKKHPLRSFFLKKELKDSLFASDEDSVEYAAVRIGAYCRNHEISELAVLSSTGGDAIADAVENLKAALAKQDISLLETEKVGTDSKALEQLIAAGKSILVEQLQGGNRQKAAELLKFCRENDVEVIGALGVVELSL